MMGHHTQEFTLINNFDLLTSYSKGEIIDYINDFYNIINDPDQVRLNFIENARTQ